MGMYCPESPKYTYIIREQVEQAERDLIRLRAKKNVRNIFVNYLALSIPLIFQGYRRIVAA
jgi:hypothetical protein